MAKSIIQVSWRLKAQKGSNFCAMEPSATCELLCLAHLQRGEGW